jgi:hypothetical protein
MMPFEATHASLAHEVRDRNRKALGKKYANISFGVRLISL